MIYIGADHAGFKRKEEIKEFLDKKKIKYTDLSQKRVDGDDYPIHAKAVSKEVKKNKVNKGILICGSGTGMVIAANKVKGIRAVISYDNYSAKMSKKDNNANVLCLRGINFPLQKTKQIINTWLNTKFSNLSRHKRRISKL